MKHLLLLLVIFYSATAIAQEVKEAEIVFKGEGKIHMKNGKELTGFLSYSYVNSTKVVIKQANGEQEKIKRSEINSFEIGDLLFEKISPSGAIVIGGNEEFAIRKTPENSKIKIHENINQGRVGSGSPALYSTSREIIISFPDKKSKSIKDLSFAPFHKKVSKLVADCPSLSKKIANKEDGYKVGFATSVPARLDIFIRLAEEYTNCK